MLENIFSDVGIQEVLAGNQGIDGTEEDPDVFTTHLWGQALQQHPLHVGLFVLGKECDIPRHHGDRNDCLQAMWFAIKGS